MDYGRIRLGPTLISLRHGARISFFEILLTTFVDLVMCLTVEMFRVGRARST